MCLENYWNRFPEHLRMYLMMGDIYGPAFIKLGQLDPQIKDQLGKDLGPLLLSWFNLNPSMDK